MKLRYYAWLRDRVGRDSEDINLPSGIRNVGMLLDWLPTRDDRFRDAFEYGEFVLVSVNSSYAHRDHPLHDEDEVALVPPIAGG
jgi:molybdopterin synthase sulfur carrier subunit